MSKSPQNLLGIAQSRVGRLIPIIATHKLAQESQKYFIALGKKLKRLLCAFVEQQLFRSHTEYLSRTTLLSLLSI